ncbi:uncharacterized protein Hap1MRO34_000031 isoform 2-T4 [Clarias gariepinus]|uniref:CMRF35-like molecule 8 isoform X2 n=1 Tax=Clarias gariepinus TaxID=13013 RepID=UPI00234CE558|nr:CMRF35-like molecule 8 isoform X2 [Clarias gariepinus]
MSCFFIFILIFSSIERFQSAFREFSLQTGSSVTIPCHYDKQYIQHRKYWCYYPKFIYNNCKIQAYANNTQGRVTVTDNPAESLFTVTMNNLQTENTGWYWCVVEIGGIMEPDVKEELYITVKGVPDLSVKESRVRGEEGGSVTVQCLYSAAYQNEQKQWCRFKNCSTLKMPESSQKSEKVLLSDDGKRSFSVEIRGLKKCDAGWYWCSAGNLQVPVHISVSDPPPVVTKTLTTITYHVNTHTSALKYISVAPVTAVSSSEENIGSKTLIYWYLMAFLLLLVILVNIICMLRMKCKAKNQIRNRERSDDAAVHTPTANMAEDSVIYSTVSQPNSASNVDGQDVTYSLVNIPSNNKPVSPNYVDDKIIYSSVVYH